MNNIDYLISVIERSIPYPVLQTAFTVPSLHGLQTNITHAIKDKVITDIVLRDCNVVAGMEVVIPLGTATVTQVTNGIVLKIPLTATYGKEITSVLSIGNGYDGKTGGGLSMMDAYAGFTVNSDARVEVVGPNTIFAAGTQFNTGMFIRCNIENDNNFGNISARALTVLADMCVQACKGYIYNKVSIGMSGDALVAGIPYGRLNETIDNYADAFEIYNDILRTQWLRINMMQNGLTHDRHIRMIVPH